MQTKDELEKWWATPDAWGYETHPDDQIRKDHILDALDPFGRFETALDIGCGEGFITRDLPAVRKYGIELSDAAASRLPEGIERISKPVGRYKLIVCTGMLYQQYDHELFNYWMKKHVGSIILTCNIKEWEINTLPEDKQIFKEEFPYREFTQILRIYSYGHIPLH